MALEMASVKTFTHAAAAPGSVRTLALQSSQCRLIAEVLVQSSSGCKGLDHVEPAGESGKMAQRAGQSRQLLRLRVCSKSLT
jgi:hypothetical protein